MYCSHCGKKVGDAMLFCPFCGEPIVVPEQDEQDQAEVENAAVAREDASKPEPAADAGDEGSVPREQAPAKADADAPDRHDDAAAELLNWDRERTSRMQEDAWARPESPAEAFVPLELDQTGQPEDDQWREQIARKKQSAVQEKKPPSMNREKKTQVQLQGSAPKLDTAAKGAKPNTKAERPRKHSNTLVPPKTMDPDNIFMDERAPFDSVDPYDIEPSEDVFEGSFAFEDDDEGSFFMRHLRSIVGLALFVILLLMFVIYAFSRAGQISLARVNVAWSKEAYSTLGYQNYQAGNYSQSGLYYERALQRDPNNYSFASSAAMAYLEAEDTDRAADMLKRCAQIDPTKLEPYIYLLRLYPDAASRPWDITQLLQQGYQRTGDNRLNVTG